MITRDLETRKQPRPNSITDEAVGTLRQDEVEKMVGEFRKRPGTRIDRVEPFSAKQNVTGFPRSEDRIHFDAAGEGASILPTTSERSISLNLKWDAPVLHHLSASDAYGLAPGTSLCVLLPGPADPETIRMLVLRCAISAGEK